MDDLGYDNIFSAMTEDLQEAADLQFRADLMLTLRRMFEEKGWKQADIARALGIPQPRVSELMRGKIDLFSADRLIGFLARLNLRLRPRFDPQQGLACDIVRISAVPA